MLNSVNAKISPVAQSQRRPCPHVALWVMEASAGNYYQFHLTHHNHIFGVWVVEIMCVYGETRNSEPRNTRPQGRGKELFFSR